MAGEQSAGLCFLDSETFMAIRNQCYVMHRPELCAAKDVIKRQQANVQCPSILTLAL